MIQSGTNLGDFLPRRLAWGIVIVVLVLIVDFALPRHLFFNISKHDLNLADRNTYMQMMGMTKAEIQQKFGPPKKDDTVKNELFYDIPESGVSSVKLSSWLRISFDAQDRCTSFAVED